MKAVPPHAIGVELTRNRVMIGDRAVRAVKRSVETGDLRQCRKAGEDRADRRQIVRLMQRCEADEPVQAGDHPVVNQDRPVEVRTAVHHAMPDSYRVNAKLVSQPCAGDAHCGRDIRNGFNRIGAVSQRIAAHTSCPQARPTANSVDLALDLPPQSALPLDQKDLELYA
ncbi:hypothetical protein ACVWW1_004942 [Bradyrhizobium sp. JR3.5]